MTTAITRDTIRRRVDLNYIEWLTEPGEYTMPSRGVGRADRARMGRIARKGGCTFRSNLDGAGNLLITIWKGVL
jgi:hypothetical protein